jgi:hypothetical protein
MAGSGSGWEKNTTDKIETNPNRPWPESRAPGMFDSGGPIHDREGESGVRRDSDSNARPVQRDEAKKGRSIDHKDTPLDRGNEIREASQEDSGKNEDCFIGDKRRHERDHESQDGSRPTG